MKPKILILLVLVAVPLIFTVQIASTPSIVADNDTVRTGSKVRIDGSGFPGSANFQIFLDELNIANGTTYAGGTFYRTITLPRMVSLGKHNITVVSGLDTAQTQITVVQWPSVLSVSPFMLRPGEQVTICGEGYPPDAYYKVYMGSIWILEGATDGNGELCRIYDLPITAPLGPARIVVNATKYTGPPSAEQSINVSQWTPQLSISPETPNPGGVVVIQGTGFPPHALYRIYLDGDEILIGSVDGSGDFSRNHRLESNFALGQHTLSSEAFKYTGPPVAVLEVSVVQWATQLRSEPSYPHPGSNVTFIGESFPPETPFQLSLDGHSIGSGNTSVSGSFTLQHNLPKNISLGLHTVLAVATEYAGPPSSSLELNIIQWPLKLSLPPSAIHPSSRINVTGRGFPPNAAYEIYLDSSLKILISSANSTGLFEATYGLSKTILLGGHTLSCIVQGYSGPPTATCLFEITEWPLETHILPPTPHPGAEIHVVGSGYPPGSIYHVLIDGLEVYMGLVSQSSGFNASCLLPRNITLGVHNITVEPNFPGLDPVNVSLSVSQWPTEISFTPISGPRNTLITLNGFGYPPEVQIRLYWDGSYIKAAESSRSGEFTIQLIGNYPDDDSYHIIEAVAMGGFTGPPSSFVYFWLGEPAPETTISICDGNGTLQYAFFVGETIHLFGTGYPKSIVMRAYLIREGDSVETEGALASADVVVDTVGSIPVTPVGAVQDPDRLRIWLDVNQNGIFDGNDVVSSTSFTVLSRPDIGIENLEVSSFDPIQGQVVKIHVDVRNWGQETVSGVVFVAYGGTQVASKIFQNVASEMTKTVVVDWDTSSTALGTEMLEVQVQPLPGEVNLTNNKWSGGQVTIRARPDISLQWLTPDSRTIHKGKSVRIRVRVRNMGLSSQVFRLTLNWGSLEITYVTWDLDAGEGRTYVFDWDTSAATVGTNDITAHAEILPYETYPPDNTMTNGSIQVIRPNHLPEPDAHGPYSGKVNSSVLFDGSWSYDIDGIIVSYFWVFGDGSSASGQVVNHTYVESGSYDVILTVTDDDGDSKMCTTTALISLGSPRHLLNILVLDSVKLTPVIGAIVSIGGKDYKTGEWPLSVELEEGSWTVLISKTGFLSAEETVVLNQPLSLSFKITPIFDLFSCDVTGVPKNDYSSNEIVYASLTAPDRYPSLLYVVSDGSTMDGQPLLDMSVDGHQYILSENGTTVTAVWKFHCVTGSYDIVLDLNSNGLFDLGSDVVEDLDTVGFRIPETFSMFALLFVVAQALRQMVQGKQSTQAH